MRYAPAVFACLGIVILFAAISLVTGRSWGAIPMAIFGVALVVTWRAMTRKKTPGR